ncbi:MAG: rhomboid family intramembrane serine protease [Blautia sp.]|nr:rhomboid family intramembrane serine protease [Blautia sp.]
MILIAVNVILFLIVDFTGGTENTGYMLQWGASFPPAIIEQGEWYRLFSSMFLHFGISHLLNNMLLLFVLGQRIEPVVGKLRYLLFYILGGLAGNWLSLLWEIKKDAYSVSAGASGAIFALMGVMICLMIRHKGHVKDLSARQVMIMAALSLYFGFASQGVDNAAHMGGMLGGFLLTLLLYRRNSALQTK